MAPIFRLLILIMSKEYDSLSNDFFPLISGKHWNCLDFMSRVLNRNHTLKKCCFEITNPIPNHPTKNEFLIQWVYNSKRQRTLCSLQLSYPS